MNGYYPPSFKCTRGLLGRSRFSYTTKYLCKNRMKQFTWISVDIQVGTLYWVACPAGRGGVEGEGSPGTETTSHCSSPAPWFEAHPQSEILQLFSLSWNRRVWEPNCNTKICPAPLVVSSSWSLLTKTLLLRDLKG